MKQILPIFLILCLAPLLQAADAPRVTKLPHLGIDVARKQVRVECEALNADMPLEFFLCVWGTQDHETLLRSQVRPSHLHQALLMIGLQPGQPVRYSESTKKWLPPQGPPMHMSCEYQKDGKTITTPAHRWIRNVKTKKTPPAFTWVFAGSRVMEDGKYAADVTGYLVTVVNFDYTVVDIPSLASSDNEALEWEYNPKVVPKAGTKVTLIIEPATDVVPPAARPAPPAEEINPVLVKLDATGKIILAGRPVTMEELKSQLAKIKSERPFSVRLAPQAPSDQVQAVAEAAMAAGATKVYIHRDGTITPDSEIIETDPQDAQIKADEAKINALRKRWEKSVKPHAEALREAAQTQYEVIAALRREQQRLIDEADRVQRVIDQLEKEWGSMTTPRPEPLPQDEVQEKPESPAPDNE